MDAKKNLAPGTQGYAKAATRRWLLKQVEDGILAFSSETDRKEQQGHPTVPLPRQPKQEKLQPLA